MRLKQYNSLESAIQALKLDEFSCEFAFAGDKLCCVDNGRCYGPSDMQLAEYHRFEAEDFSQTTMVFAVICDDGTKGLMTYTYGSKIDMNIITFFDKVKILSEDHIKTQSRVQVG